MKLFVLVTKICRDKKSRKSERAGRGRGVELDLNLDVHYPLSTVREGVTCIRMVVELGVGGVEITTIFADVIYGWPLLLDVCTELLEVSRRFYISCFEIIYHLCPKENLFTRFMKMIMYIQGKFEILYGDIPKIYPISNKVQ